MKLLGRAFSTVLAYPKSINVSFLSQTITTAIYLINICYASTMCQDLQQRLANYGPKKKKKLRSIAITAQFLLPYPHLCE